jgi:hypothetical protein
MPHLRWLFVAWGAAAVIWGVLEGDIRRVQLFGFLSAAAGLAYLFQRIMAGRKLAPLSGLALLALWGLALGVGTALMTLFLMAVKTGLHAHGPEFTPLEIALVGQRLPLWAGAGLLASIGAGLLLLSHNRSS